MNYVCTCVCAPVYSTSSFNSLVLKFILCQTTSELTCFCPRQHLSTRLTTTFNSFFITNTFLRTVYFNHNFLSICSSLQCLFITFAWIITVIYKTFYLKSHVFPVLLYTVLLAWNTSSHFINQYHSLIMEWNLNSKTSNLKLSKQLIVSPFSNNCFSWHHI